MDSGQDLPGAERVLMPVSYTITHDVSILNLYCEKYRKSNPMEKADHIGRAPLLCTLTVLLFFLEDGGTRQRFKSLRDFTLPWGKELW